MAKLLDLHPNTEDVKTYKIEDLGFEGTPNFCIEIYPVASDYKSSKLMIKCSPDYRQHRSHYLFSPKKELQMGLQSLRFGWDFFCRGLEQQLGLPSEVNIYGFGPVPLDLVNEIIKPCCSLDDRISLLYSTKSLK